jgi:S1-C subfamily serine protease
MDKPRRSFRAPFISALLGGAVVAVFGAIAIAAGWIHSDGGSTTTVAAPLSAPVVSKSSDESANVVNQIYKNDGDGVAFIESQIPAQESQTLSPFGEPESEGGGTATGSGFVIDSEGHVLTNNHVIEGADKIEVKLGASDTEYRAKVVGLDRTVTSGIVSALQRQIEAPDGFSITNVIQTDAAINPGNSGGPLINAEGEVIGINSQIATGGGGNGNVGIGFAIPIDTARSEIHQLIANGEVEHAFIGISGGTITPELAKEINLPVKEGVIVQSVVKGGPAAKAGIEGGTTSATIDGAEVSLGGDIITEVDGKKISGMEEVVEIVNKAKPGESLELTIVRDGSTKTATVTLGDRPDSVESK